MEVRLSVALFPLQVGCYWQRVQAGWHVEWMRTPRLHEDTHRYSSSPCCCERWHLLTRTCWQCISPCVFTELGLHVGIMWLDLETDNRPFFGWNTSKVKKDFFFTRTEQSCMQIFRTDSVQAVNKIVVMVYKNSEDTEMKREKNLKSFGELDRRINHLN